MHFNQLRILKKSKFRSAFPPSNISEFRCYKNALAIQFIYMLSNVYLLQANFYLDLVRLHQLLFIFNQIVSHCNLPKETSLYCVSKKKGWVGQKIPKECGCNTGMVPNATFSRLLHEFLKFYIPLQRHSVQNFVSSEPNSNSSS